MSVTPRPGGPAPAEARKIADDGELRAIAGAGAGFVIDPFNRRWHVATCRRVAAMTTGQPKWHAGTPAAREAFLEQRLCRVPEASARTGRAHQLALGRPASIAAALRFHAAAQIATANVMRC